MPRGGLPEEYVEFVAAYADDMRTVATRLVGHDRRTEAAVREALSALALRWDRLPAGRRLPFAMSRLERAAAEDSGAGLDMAPPEHLAASAWVGGALILRRRLLIAAGVTGLAGLLALGGRMGSSPEPGSTVEPPPERLPNRVRVVPETAALSTLRIRNTALPAQLTAPTALETPLLGGRPLPRAVALLDTGDGVFALGPGGEFRLLDDPDSHFRVSRGTHRSSWVHPSSLTLDGSRAALALGDVLVVVDLPTGRQRRFVLEGSLTTQVAWLADGRVMYAQGGRSAVLDPATGIVRPVPYDVEEVAVGPGPDLVQVDSPIGGAPAQLSTWPASATDSQPPGPPSGPLPQGTPMTSNVLGLARELAWVGYWDGTGWLRGNTLARACNASEMRMPVGYGQPHFATVALDLSGAFRGGLIHEARNGAPPSAPVVHGWLDDDTVLVRLGDSSYRPLVAWDVSTGKLSLVSNLHSESRISVSSVE